VCRRRAPRGRSGSGDGGGRVLVAKWAAAVARDVVGRVCRQQGAVVAIAAEGHP
jgi:hypothetical protein